MDIITYWTKFCTPFVKARFGTTERGASLVEYALLVALIAVVCIGAVTFVGSKGSAKFSTIGSKL